MFNIRPSIIKETIANRSFVIFALGATAATTTTRNNEQEKVNFYEQLKKSWIKITFIVENQHGNTDLTTLSDIIITDITCTLEALA